MSCSIGRPWRTARAPPAISKALRRRVVLFNSCNIPEASHEPGSSSKSSGACSSESVLHLLDFQFARLDACPRRPLISSSHVLNVLPPLTTTDWTDKRDVEAPWSPFGNLADTQGAVASTSTFIIAVFRGTQELEDWATNLEAVPRSFAPWGQAHAVSERRERAM